MSQDSDDRIIFEIIRLGAYLKVTAVDPRSHIEVSVMGPATGAQELLKRLAVQKLRRAVLGR